MNSFVVQDLQHGKAQIVDVMRLLLSYICDSFIALGQDNLPKREITNASVRQLISELVELCFVDSGLVDLTQRQFLSTGGQSTGPPGQTIMMKRGDWTCSKYILFRKHTCLLVSRPSRWIKQWCDLSRIAMCFLVA